MKSVLSKLLSRPEAKEIVGEWARHIRRKKDPAVFANLYLEIMRDPKNNSLRRDACAFLMYASSRDWDEMLAALKPAVDKETFGILNSSSAAIFYECWVLMVRTQVEEYFRGEVEKAKKNRKRKTG